MSVLVSLASVLLNILVGGIIVIVIALFTWLVISNAVGDQLNWGKLLRPALVCILSFVTYLIISTKFHDSYGDVPDWVKPFQFFFGVVSGCAAILISVRIFLAMMRNLLNSQRKYRQWYTSLTLEQQLLEDIRQNTLRQAREASEMRFNLEQQRKNRFGK
jgi:hypothetical protein